MREHSCITNPEYTGTSFVVWFLSFQGVGGPCLPYQHHIKQVENTIITSPRQPVMYSKLAPKRGLFSAWCGPGSPDCSSARHLVGKMVISFAHDCSSQPSYAYVNTPPKTNS